VKWIFTLRALAAQKLRQALSDLCCHAAKKPDIKSFRSEI
jgi:hypothetical protein